MLKLAVVGAGGKMGLRVVALARQAKDFELIGALEEAGHAQQGCDIGVAAGIGEIGIKVSEELAGPCDVMIDFSTPGSIARWAPYAAEKRIALVVGTTGLAEEHIQILRQAAKKTAVLAGANMSMGVNLLFKLAAEVAGVLDENYDVEIVERHHRFKRDAPSGTALELARRIASAKNWPWPSCLVHGREGRQTLRQPKTIGMHAVRAGDTIGRHDVIFSTLGETVELHHTAHTRDTFVRGALHAARWLVGQRAGWYGMSDVLGL